MSSKEETTFESWKDIPNYVGYYQVSSLGNIRGLDRRITNSLGYTHLRKGKILDGILINGYKVVHLRSDRFNKNIKVHQLVAMAFMNHIPNGMSSTVHHINHNRADNRLVNLKLMSCRENVSLRKSNKTSRYVGVSRHRNKWRAEIQINRKSLYLGLFTNELDASEAYKKAIPDEK